MSLRTRFMIYVTLLLSSLVVMVLFVIQKREVRMIFEEERKKGVLIAENIIQQNLEPFLFWDVEGVKTNIENRIDRKLVFVVFFDRNNRLFAATSTIDKNSSVFLNSNLENDVQRGEYYFSRKSFKLKSLNDPLKILEIEVPVFVEGSTRKWGSIKIGLSLEDMEAEIRKTRMVLLAIGGAGLFVGMLGSLFLTRRIIFPLKKLADGTVQISKGDFTQKIDISSQDEIGELARSFNRMSDELLKARDSMESAHKKLLHAEKLASIGRLSASIAHEIRNPLTSVKLNIQRISESENLEELEKEHLDICQEGIRQIEKFIKELLSFTRLSEINLTMFSLEQIINESIRVLKDVIDKKKINLEKEFQNNLPKVKVDGDRMRQVFLNLIQNAVEAVDEGGRIKITLAGARFNGKSGIRVEISDNGCGIKEKDRQNIFEPFYTTKASGFGLGLANARKIVEQHNGVIRVKETQQKGACFEVFIPD